MPKLYANVGGKSKEVKKFYCSLNGSSKALTKIYASVGGKAKLIYGQRPKSQYGTVYYKETEDGETKSIELNSLEEFNKLASTYLSNGVSLGGVTLYSKDYPAVVGVDIGNKVTAIPNLFLAGCLYLSMPVIIPDSVVTIGEAFLSNCANFNQPLTIGTGVRTINGNFMLACKQFNQPLTIPNSVSSIYTPFMCFCENMVSEITVECPASVLNRDAIQYYLINQTSNVSCVTKGIPIGGTYARDWVNAIPDFMTDRFHRYRKLMLASPDPVKGYGIIYYRESATSEVKTVQIANEAEWLQLGNKSSTWAATFSGIIVNNDRYPAITGIVIGDAPTELPEYFLRKCTYISMGINIPNNITTIGDHVMRDMSFNALITLPATLKTIGKYFMYNTKSYCQSLTIPSGVTSVGANFFRNANDYEDRLIISCPATAFVSDAYTLASETSTAPIYVTGVMIAGISSINFRDRFPNSTTSPYRNLKQY